MVRSKIPLLAALWLLAPVAARATSIFGRSLAERARIADRVVLAQVLESRTVVPKGNPRRMQTITRVVVGRNLKGAGPTELEILQLGGRSGLWEARVPGDATFEPGEVALLLLRCPDAPAKPFIPSPSTALGVDQVEGERQQSNRCFLVGLGEGKILVHGDEALVRSIARGAFTRRPLAALLDEIRSPPKVTR